MMTQAQSQALAAFIARVRTDWDHPGIVAAIGKASGLGSAFDVARALVNLAENRDLTSPGLLSQPGRHWMKANDEPTGPNVTHNVRCPEHPSSFHPCPQCAAKRCAPTPDYLEAKASLVKPHARAATPDRAPKLTDAESAAIARARIDRSQP